MAAERPPADLDLSACEREPIRVPGAVQPHGVLFSLGEPGLTVLQVSDSVERHLGVPASRVVGRPLAEVLPGAEAVRSALAANGSHLDPLRLEAAGTAFDALLHRHAGALLLELEPVGEEPDEHALHRTLRRVVTALQAAASRAELGRAIVAGVRRVTGFDRVLLYRFDEDGHGVVEAEDKADGLDPYLGLHYPASDIPRQARRLYLENRLRIIPDGRYAPSPLVPTLRPDDGEPLDLGPAALRAVSPIHLEYMANMGVRASMSVSLVVRGRLWGLIGCVHHQGPLYLPYAVRAFCETLGELTALHLGALEDRRVTARRAARQADVEELATAMRAAPADLLSALAERPELLRLVGAGGAAIVGEGDPVLVGGTPPAPRVAELATWLDERGALAPFATSALATLHPPAADLAAVASGLLAFALPGRPHRRLLWFRPEQVHTVRWGGDPRKPVEPGATRLHPRRSFEQWKEEVRQRSRAWSAADLEAAEELRRAAVEIDLERQVESQLQAVRVRDDLIAVVSHDLRNPLGIVQMQTTLMQMALGTGDDPPTRRLRDGVERIQRAAERMTALVESSLDLAKIESGRFSVVRRSEDAAALVREALGMLAPLAQRKRIELVDRVAGSPAAEIDRDRLFQVLSNLIGNAIKFTPEEGRVAVGLEAADGELLFTVHDSGPGLAAEQLPHLFDRYWQAKQGGREGSGLGLYIAKGIVEAHGGRIWAESPPGSGAVLRFTIPVS